MGGEVYIVCVSSKFCTTLHMNYYEHVTKYLDEKTNNNRTTNLPFKFRDDKTEQTSKLHMLSCSQRDREHREKFERCDWVNNVLHAMKNA